MFCPFLCGFGWGLMSRFLPTSPAQAGGNKEKRGASDSLVPVPVRSPLGRLITSSLLPRPTVG